MNPYTISEFIAKLQEYADGFGDLPVTLMFAEPAEMWDVDELDIAKAELVEDDNRIYINIV